MSRWRIIVVLFLLTLPILFFIGAGSFYLWQSSWSFYFFLALVGSILFGCFLAWNWQRQKKLLPRPQVDAEWTDRDRQAWQLVEARAKAIRQFDTGRLTDPQFYFDMTQELALELAKFYHPNARDPVSSLTIPEILAAVELAAGDLSEMVDKSVPGSHVMTIGHWKKAKQAAGWLQKATKAYGTASALISPKAGGLHYLASQFGLPQLQENLLGWFAGAFVERTGRYLIDLNSGRLKIGATKYRETVK